VTAPAMPDDDHQGTLHTSLAIAHFHSLRSNLKNRNGDAGRRSEGFPGPSDSSVGVGVLKDVRLHIEGRIEDRQLSATMEMEGVY